MVITTRKQREALFRIFQRDWPSYITPRTRHNGWQCPHCHQWSEPEIYKIPSINYRRFRKTVQPYFDKSGCVLVPWKGMWLGIEVDGYTHS
jgi:hypothetical protein